MADLADARVLGRAAHVLRERLRLLPRHDGRDRRDLARRRADRAREPVGARAYLRRRGREPLGRLPSRGVPGAGRRAASRGRLPQQRRVPRLLQGVGRLGARVRRRLGLLGRACVGRPRARGRRRRCALDLPLRSVCRTLRRADPGRAHARGAGLSRGVGRRLSARDARARHRARRLERDLPAALDGGHAGARRLERGRLAARLDDARRPIRTGSTGTSSAESVRAPVRPAPTRDRGPPRRHGAALGAQLRPHARGHPRPRSCDLGSARGRSRRPLDVGVRGLWPHDVSRDTRRAAGLGRGERGPHGPAPDRDDGSRASGPRRPRPPLDA